MSVFSKQTSYLGADIGAHGIKLVELRVAKGRPQLFTYAILDEPLDIHLQDVAQSVVSVMQKDLNDKDKKRREKRAREWLSPEDKVKVEKYSTLLASAMKAARVHSRQVTASLPVSHIFHAVFTFPSVPQKEIKNVVDAEVQKVLPRPLEEMQIAYQILSSPSLSSASREKTDESSNKNEEKYIHILVTAAPKSLVAFFSSIFQRAGFKLQELETEAFALERSLVGRDRSTAMIVDIGAERTNFFIMDQGFPMTHRSMEVGGNLFDQILSRQLGVDQALASGLKLDITRLSPEQVPSSLFAEMLDELVKEIQYSFDLFLHQSGNEEKRPEKIILTGGASVLPMIAPTLRAAFPMKVFVGDPWARVVYPEKLKHVLDEIGPRMAVSIGLALRNIVSP